MIRENLISVFLFTFVQDDTLPSAVILNGARMLCEKNGKWDSGTE